MMGHKKPKMDTYLQAGAIAAWRWKFGDYRDQEHAIESEFPDQKLTAQQRRSWNRGWHRGLVTYQIRELQYALEDLTNAQLAQLADEIERALARYYSDSEGQS